MDTNEPSEYLEIIEIDDEGSLPIIIDEQSTIEQQTTSAAALLTSFPERLQIFETNLELWAIIDGVLLIFILSGNILTILAVLFSKRLRSVTSNMFILSLAISDLIVGLMLPFNLMFYINSNLSKSRELCLLRFFIIIFACSISIWNLIVIAVDRYIAIVYPLHYSRCMTKKLVLILIGCGCIIGTIVALIPMFWNNWSASNKCEFNQILPIWYVAGIMTPGFTIVWSCMMIMYWRIWREASKHAKQLRLIFADAQNAPSDWKSIQVVVFILGCFTICWIPYFVICCGQILNLFNAKTSAIIYESTFSLAIANSGINPIIYAWKNSNFRKAFLQMLRFKSPNQNSNSQLTSRSNIHRKSSGLSISNVLTKNNLTENINFINEKKENSIHVLNITNNRKISLVPIHMNSSESKQQTLSSSAFEVSKSINQVVRKDQSQNTCTCITDDNQIALLNDEALINDMLSNHRDDIVRKIWFSNNESTKSRFLQCKSNLKNHFTQIQQLSMSTPVLLS